MSWLVPALLALALLATLRLSRQPLRGGAWRLLRSLLPSWRFFEDIELGPELSFRVWQGAQPGAWQPALPAPTRRLSSVLLDADGNLHLARQSLVEQLWSELDGQEVDAATTLVSYRLVQLLVVQRAAELGLAHAGARYQFRLGSAQPGEGFVSREHPL